VKRTEDIIASAVKIERIAATAFLCGLTDEGFRQEELDYHHPDFSAFVFFFSRLLATISLWLATKIANHHIGLINTIVFTHIPASLFLIAVAFVPTAWIAVLFWQQRSFLGQMDVPTRQSYTMSVVQPNERVAMADVSSVGSSISGTAGPPVATALWSAFSASVPFVTCGVQKNRI